MSDETTTTGTTATTEATTPAGAQNTGKTEAADAATEKAVPYERFAEVNKRAKEAEKKLADLDNATKAAETARLKEQGEYKTLAEKAAARVAELEPLAEAIQRKDGVIKQFLDAERKGLPKHILALLDKLDPTDQLEYIAANRADLKPKGNGPPETPKADGEHDKISDEERRKRAYQATSL
jgi:hypothetical protein